MICLDYEYNVRTSSLLCILLAFVIGGRLGHDCDNRLRNGLACL